MQWTRLDLSPLSPRFAHTRILTCIFTWQKVQPLSFRWGLFCHSAALRRATVVFTYPICARMLGSMRGSWVAWSVPQLAFPQQGPPFPFLPSPLPLSVGPLPCLQCWGRERGGGVAVPFPPWINSWEPHFLLIKIHKSTAVPMVKKIHMFCSCHALDFSVVSHIVRSHQFIVFLIVAYHLSTLLCSELQPERNDKYSPGILNSTVPTCVTLASSSLRWE